MHTKTLTLLAFILLFIIACEEPFPDAETDSVSLINISGNITNAPDGPPIRVFRSYVNTSSSRSSVIPVLNARVEVLENESNAILFETRSSDPGLYYPPEGFMATPDTPYQLKITMPDGSVYLSSSETMPDSKATLKDIHQIFEVSDAPRYSKDFFVGHSVYLDFEDPVGKGDFYFMSYRLFQEQLYCYDAPIGIEIIPCEYNCWDILASNNLNIITDEFYDGSVIENRLLGKIPYYEAASAMLEINLESIPKEAYEYFKLILEQTEKTGTLADTPPSSFQGNIQSTSSDALKATGYFFVSNMEQSDYWLDRSEVDPSQITPINVFERLSKNVQSALALCQNSYSRTNRLPDLWKNPINKGFQPN